MAIMKNTTYELDDAAIDLIAQMFASIKAAEVGISTVVAYFAKQNRIEGTIKLGDDRRSVEVIRAPGTPEPAPPHDLVVA